MRDLPRGTVTFLFTDIEGSTRLLHELGAAAYAGALQEHRGVLRGCFARHDGVEVDTQGDAFFVAFPTATGAVTAAAEAQTELAGGPVAVRMGVHTGTPLLTDEGYVGGDVHLGARIAAVAHGGQVLLSEQANRLGAADVVDLGEHRLKDIPEPVQLFQLGDALFPPLRTISNTNLPRPASSFVGRGREVAQVLRIVRDGARLVTLTGPGGTGKTRLAIEAAAELVPAFKAGVLWVGLAALRDPELVVDTIARTLGAQGDLSAHVGERELLLLLDNFEQVVDAAPELSSLLQSCPNLRLLVTSRELLRIQGEVECAVAPLAEREAVELFCARAQVEPDEDVTELCRRLDNLPLAVELAAARAGVLTPRQIVDRLGQRLDLRGGRDADPRQQTLRATIEWSHELLSQEERRLFARLAVFAGGATLQAVEQVTGADIDTLQSLVAKSLVRRTGERFWMLETIREYAVEQLECSGESAALERALAEYLLTLAESANLTAESEGHEHPELVRPELDNFRRAIDWAAEHDLELAYRLAVGIEQVWVMNDPFDGERRLSALLERGSAVPAVLRARALRACSETRFISGDFQGAGELLERSLAEFEALGDERAVTVVIHRQGVGALVTDDLPRARRFLEQSRARCGTDPNPKLEADIVHKLGWVERMEGNPERALELFEQSVLLLGRVGFTWMQASALMDVADLSHELGRTDAVAECAREAVRLSWELGDRQFTVYSLAWLARFAIAGGRVEDAGRLWGAVEAEEARGPLGGWERDREEFAAAVLVDAGPEFEAGRARGRTLSLEQAVDHALAGPG